MPIRVVCPACSCAFRIADAAAGKKGKCPKCAEPLTIPNLSPPEPLEIDLVPIAETEAPMALDSSNEVRGSSKTAGNSVKTKKKKAGPVELGDEDLITTATLTPQQILAAFQDVIEPVKTTGMYRLWIGLVAGFMLLLPVLYLGVIGLVGFLIYYHLVNHVGMVTMMPVRSGKAVAFMVGLYLTPAIAGLALIAFLFKPFFASSGRAGKMRVLDPSKEPLLFAFVDGVCQTVGARTPARIEVDCDVNASARLSSGPFSRDLVLTIGLPLVGGLNMKQFAGVLAHEFGHFSQGVGMRVSYMIRSVNMWFARVVYERDAWDEKIEQLCHSGDNGQFFGWVFKAAVWLSRRVLWVFMMAGHMISGFLSRQMEYDADRYESRMVGGEVFESTARKLKVLGVATQGAFIDLQNSLREGTLADNLPKLIVANVSQIPKEVMEKIDEAVTEGNTGLFDTHPCDRERIFRAHAEDTDGVFHLEGPATDVFRDFDSLCRVATYEHYKSIFGPNGVDKDSLRPVGDVVRTQTAAMKGSEALRRFYQGVFSPYRPFLLPEKPPTAPPDAKAAKTGLISARQRMAETIEQYEESLKSFDELWGEGFKVSAATAMIKADFFKFKASDFALTRSNLDCAKQAAKEISDDLEKLDETLSIRESATIRRIHGALSLLENEHIGELVADADTWRDEIREIYPVARHIGRTVIPALGQAVKAHQALQRVIATWAANQQNENIHNAVLRAGKILAEALTELRWKLGDSIAYPFEHKQAGISLARYALPDLPDEKDINGLLNVGGDAIDRVIPLHYRLVGRLMLATEAVEKALGLESLPERPKKEDEGEGEVEEVAE